MLDDPSHPPAPGGEPTAPGSRPPPLPAGPGPAVDPTLLQNPSLSPDSAAHDHIPAEIRQRFRNLRFLGKGGMGTVYCASDIQLGRDVALKFIHADASSRFLREARAQAMVQHDNICKIFDVGVAEGRPYITMQLVVGRPLHLACDEMSLAEKVKVVRESAAALHEAHRLGLVHRDMKPANILVERGENGLWKPYVMDFGLARVAGELGETATGALAGTPAYMAPEQARGDIRALDRRTDVYALGATLYYLIAGRPPFVEEQLGALLQRIEHEGPPTLRDVKVGVPADLDTIVMTCLERDPARRYDSARALGEDLQRYLDGEPVLARPTGRVYRVIRRVRKHRVVASLLAVLLVSTAVFVAITVRARQLAARDAELARGLGADLKEVELFMDRAHALPLHDIERERAIVRARLVAMAAGSSAADAGPVHAAIGRGYLALQDPETALVHLQQAEASHDSPDLEYALGRAKLELYRAGLAKLPRITDATLRAARQAELEATYKLPAQDHLRAATGVRLEHPLLLAGLVALIDGRTDDALRAGQQLEQDLPWSADGAMLVAEAHYALGKQFKHDAAFDLPRMLASVDPALAAYRRAADIGRSDPRVHTWGCDLLTQVVLAKNLGFADTAAAAAEGSRVCDSAVATSPGSRDALKSRAFFRTALAVQYARPGLDLVALRVDALVAIDALIAADPDDAFAHWLRGATVRTEAYALWEQRADQGPALAAAVAAFERALELDPTFGWPASDLAMVYTPQLEHLERTGGDPFPALERAHAALERAYPLARDAPFVLMQRCMLRILGAKVRLSRGLDPSAELAAGERAFADLSTKVSRGEVAVLGVKLLDQVQQFAIFEGRDAAAASARADRLFADSPAFVSSARGLVHLLAARAAFAGGDSPATHVKAAQAAYTTNIREHPQEWPHRCRLAEALLLGIRGAMARDEARAADFDAALAVLTDVLTGVDPEPFHLTAAILERRAAWRLTRGEPAAQDIADGLARADDALTRNPRMAVALATRGALHLLAANTAATPDERRAAATRARESLTAALALNGFLTREYEPHLREATRLAAL